MWGIVSSILSGFNILFLVMFCPGVRWALLLGRMRLLSLRLKIKILEAESLIMK